MSTYKMSYGSDWVIVTLGLPEDQVLIDGESFGRQFADFSCRIEPAMRAAAAHCWGPVYESVEAVEADGRDPRSSAVTIWDDVEYYEVTTDQEET